MAAMETTLDPITPRKRSAVERILRITWLGPAIAVIAIYVFFGFFGGATGFLTASGTAGWLNTAAELGIIAVRIGLLMISGEFDLSTGSVVGASAIIVALGSGFYGIPVGYTIVAALSLGVLVGT